MLVEELPECYLRNIHFRTCPLHANALMAVLVSSFFENSGYDNARHYCCYLGSSQSIISWSSFRATATFSAENA
jgi:hypothetical protein